MAEENKKVVEEGAIGDADSITSKISFDDNEKKENIFDDFSTDDSLDAEVAKLREEQNKDIFFYMHILGKGFQIGVAFLMLIIFLLGMYIFVQKKEDFSNQSFLDPICVLLNGDVPSPETSCASITYTSNYYKTMLDTIYKNQVTSIITVLPKIYEYENLINTKEISFLLDKSKTKLNILHVLEGFFDIQNEFNSTERQKIQCRDYNVNVEKRILSASCTARSQGFERNNIMGFSGEDADQKVGGTSVSVANSFLNYIEKLSLDVNKNSQVNFTLIDRQKMFNIENIVDAGYTNKTEFDIKLKINF